MAKWRDDVDALGRKKDADFLTNLLQGRFLRDKTREWPPLVLNINAPWGTGKTFLLDHWAADLEEQGWFVLRFNAWEYDYANDPLLSFIAAIDKQLQEKTHVGTRAKKAAKNLSISLGVHLAEVAPLV